MDLCVKSVKNLTKIVATLFAMISLSSSELSSETIVFRNTEQRSKTRFLLPQELDKALKELSKPNSEMRKQKEKYAVLLSGDYKPEFFENIKEAYLTLKDLGFKEENIFILAPNFIREDFENTLEKIPNKNYITTINNYECLEKILKHLEDVVDNNDLFVFYSTAHGRIEINDKNIVHYTQLYNKEIKDTELLSMLFKINAEKYFILFANCYSGQILARLKEFKGNIYAISITDSEHLAYTGHFEIPFWRCLRYNLNDLNDDGESDLNESFIFGKIKAIKYFKQIPNDKVNPNALEYKIGEYPKKL